MMMDLDWPGERPPNLLLRDERRLADRDAVPALMQEQRARNRANYSTSNPILSTLSTLCSSILDWVLVPLEARRRSATACPLCSQ